MNVELLISTIVRQTTVLIAQVATTAGVRAPLASVANQVFLDLVRDSFASAKSSVAPRCCSDLRAMTTPW